MAPAPSDRERFPALFNQSSIDRRTCQRIVPMKVLVIGMMRTGTKSMQKALQELGYNDVYHMGSCIINPPDCDMWTQALNAKYFGKGKKFGKEDWDQLLGHSAFMPELINVYPDAKVILSMRNPDAWFQSVTSTVMRYTDSSFFFLQRLDPLFLGRWIPMINLCFRGIFGSPEEFATNGKQTYINMHNEVRNVVPADRLLEYKLGEGWDRLCEFLGHEVPNMPFPKLNDGAEFQDRLFVIKKLALLRAAKSYLPVLGALSGIIIAACVWYRG